MRFHASCAAWPGPGGNDAVLLLGPPGSGKSSLLLRLLDCAWQLVADDQVLVENNFASAPASLAGILEVRGLGLFRLPYLTTAPLRLAVQLDIQVARLPVPASHKSLGLPLIALDPARPCAPARLKLALAAACGRATQIVGTFAA